MKNFRLFLVATLLFIVFIFGLKVFHNFNISRKLKNEEKNRLKQSAEVLNECFDLENKSKRSINESIKLIEYCLEIYENKN